jgi:DNA-binding CsgD family transcriptional regulator
VSRPVALKLQEHLYPTRQASTGLLQPAKRQLVAGRREPAARIPNDEHVESIGWEAGASGYLLKNAVHDELIDAIRRVHTGRRTLSSEVAIELATHATDPLTPAEISVLHLIAAGNSNRLIADQLLIKEDTVKGRVTSILSKLGANDRTHAVTIGLKRGIIELSEIAPDELRQDAFTPQGR